MYQPNISGRSEFPSFVPQMPSYVPQMFNSAPHQTAQAPRQNVQWIPVNGIDGARAHIVQPGVTAWLMDNNDTLFYVKSADALGVTSLKVYRFEEVGLPAVNAGVGGGADYVSRTEFEEWIKKISAIIGGNTNGESVDK